MTEAQKQKANQNKIEEDEAEQARGHLDVDQ